MTYREHVFKNKKTGQKIYGLLALNAGILCFVVLTQLQGTLWELLGMIITSLCLILIWRWSKKQRQPLVAKKEMLLKNYGERPVIAQGRGYLGFVFWSKGAVIGICLLYIGLVLWILSDIYSGFEGIEAFVPWILAAHGLLALGGVWYGAHIEYSDVFILDDAIVFSTKGAVQFETIVKKQYFESHNGDYIFELNSSERFDRILVKSELAVSALACIMK